jgi:hypothetical protein
MLTFSACIHKTTAFQLSKPSLHSFRYNNRLSMSAVRVTTYNVLSSHLGMYIYVYVYIRVNILVNRVTDQLLCIYIYIHTYMYIYIYILWYMIYDTYV